ncbi:uncharacterized protein LOC118791132 [Megalops cyprinoides]|uniref:uncharacterized protein LOC118791132 n=1 Tax=Megalops cyprinoides TaxID=118141 RepID=UPI001864FB8F|nr:uncharacterized protein LOC118791132 [Megalops cyprinoides]
MYTDSHYVFGVVHDFVAQWQLREVLTAAGPHNSTHVNYTSFLFNYYSELLTTVMMYSGNECEGCIGFYASFPRIHPDQIFHNATTVRSLGVVVKDQVIKWDHITSYMTIRNNNVLFTTRPCCHEISSYIICTCNTLQPVSLNDTKLINVQSFHGFEDAIQVSHTQWCIISEITAFSYGDLSCPANHTFCLEVTEDFTMGQLNILGRVPMDADISPWSSSDTFYEASTRAVADIMELVQQMVQEISYHRNQAQVEVNLAKQTSRILTSASTRSAQYVYTWWDWIFRGRVIASLLVLPITVVQCCYFKHLITSLRSALNTSAAQRGETVG